MSGAERSNLNDSRHQENDDYEITSSFDALEQVKFFLRIKTASKI